MEMYRIVHNRNLGLRTNFYKSKEEVFAYVKENVYAWDYGTLSIDKIVLNSQGELVEKMKRTPITLKEIVNA